MRHFYEHFITLEMISPTHFTTLHLTLSLIIKTSKSRTLTSAHENEPLDATSNGSYTFNDFHLILDPTIL